MLTDASGLAGALERMAARQPAAPALHVRGRLPLNYADLAAQIAYVRRRFAEWGIAPGDIVAGFVPSRPEMVIASATLPAAATVVPLGPSLSRAGYVAILRRLRPKAVLVAGLNEHALGAAAHELDLAEIVLTAEPGGPAGRFTLDLARATESLRRASQLTSACAFVMVTSGTTGRPKLVLQEHGELLRHAAIMRDWLRIVPTDVSCHLLAPHLSHALRNGLLVPLLAGQSIVCLDEADVDGFFRAFDDFAPTYLSAGFTLYRELLRRAPDHRDRLARGRLRFLRVGTGRLEPEEIDRLEQTFGVPALKGLTLTEGAASQDPLPPRVRKRDALGLPIGNEVAILRDAGGWAGAGETGEIVMRGPALFRGYLDDPELNAKSFIDGWFRTGDAGYLDEDGYLHHVGRVKEMINRGGEKFSPPEIDAILESLAGVKEAAAFGVAHPRLGEEVVAAVVREAGSRLSEQDVIEHARSRIGLAGAPRRVYFVDRLPRNDGGKVRRDDLRHLAGKELTPTTTPESTRVRALSPLETAVAALFAATLHRPLGPDDDFFLMGGDSLNAAHLLAQVQNVFGVGVAVRVLFDEGATVAGMARLIERRRSGEPPATRKESAVAAARPSLRQPTALSATQRRAWFLSKFDPGNIAYNEARVHRLSGPVSVPALQEALRTLLWRHAVLRSTYSMIDGEPMQLVDDGAQIGLEVADLSASAAEQREAALNELLVSIADRPFDLEIGPLARFLLVRLGDGEHVFVRVWHHIIADGLSAAIFERELSSAYNALASERPIALPALALAYSDYAAWQNERLDSDALQRQLEYWKDKLDDLSTLRLPTDRPRPPVQSFRGARVEMALTLETIQKLAAIGRSSGATQFMTLLTAFYVLLHRYSDDDDIAIGTPIAGRTRAELEAVVGFFANTLVLRVDLSSEPTFLELLGRVRETALDAYTHQELPFERLVEALAPKRDPSRNPLFQVSFGLQTIRWTELVLDRIEVRRVLPPTTHAKIDLTLTLRPIDGGMSAIWEYCADLFAASTIDRMAAHFVKLLESIAADPTQRIGRIPMHSGAERARIDAWSRTVSSYPNRAGIHELVRAQAAALPDAVAMVDENRSLSYRQLEARANRLADYLRAHGVEPQHIVGVCVERSPGMVVAYLATLKLGAAYVPLEPDLPQERLAFLIRDCSASVVLTRSKHLPQLADAPCQVLCLDREREAIGARSSADCGQPVRSTEVACVMYTSGSTGEPKGVALTHQGIVRLVRDTNYLQLGRGDMMAQVFNASFDPSALEIWGALLNGAGLAIIQRETLLSPRALLDALDRHKVTTLVLTTALFNQVARDAPEVFTGRQMIFGGEAADPQAVAAALRDGKPKRLLNVYGPTEATAIATAFEIEAMDPDATTVPIGRPISNTEVYILDRYREPVPIGVASEIYIGGPGVARGYLNRPEQTAERFVPHPFDPAPGARLYRSGDRARYRPDGLIEFIGRQDRQIKIRGQRIEPGEVEAALAKLPQIREAIVVVHGNNAETRRLIAYVVGAAARPVASELTRELQATLPQYMLPSSIVVLDALPLTSRGKVDRRALPEPSDAGAQRTGPHAPPRDPLQHMLAEIWEELLGVSQIGIHDSFFDLGGHSLLAAQMMDAVERACGRSVPLTTLFRSATIAELARSLSGAAKVARDPVTVVNAAGSRPPFFFLHGDFTGGGFYSRELSRALGPDQPFYAVHPHGLIDPDVPASIEAMAADRLRSLRQVRPRGPYALGGHCNGAFVALELAQRLLREGESVPVLILMDGRAPWRATRVFDGVSVGEQRARSGRPASEASVSASTVPERKATLYRRAMAAYVPEPYAGHAVVLRSEENNDLRPSLGWSAIAPGIQTYTIAGDHHTSITRHVASTGAQIKAVLEAAFDHAGLLLNRAAQ